jgi:hypothetical protein
LSAAGHSSSRAESCTNKSPQQRRGIGSLCGAGWTGSGEHSHYLTFWHPDAKNAVAAMREMGTKTFLLGRDTQNVTTMGGENSAWMKPSGSCWPIRKHRWLSQLRANNRKAAMLGDGINECSRLGAGVAVGSEPMLPGER